MLGNGQVYLARQPFSNQRASDDNTFSVCDPTNPVGSYPELSQQFPVARNSLLTYQVKYGQELRTPASSLHRGLKELEASLQAI